MTELLVGLLGPLSVTLDGAPVHIASPKQAAILAVLAVESGGSVSPTRLIELVWGSDASDGVEHTLQQHISSLRKLLEPERAPRQAPTTLLTRRHGYELRASVDVVSFERLGALGAERAAAGEWDGALDALAAASRLWRGAALADVRVGPWFDAIAARLDDRWLAVREVRADVLLAQGRHGELVLELEDLLAANPFREPAWGQLMVALYRSGRAADALAAYGRARAVLLDELGLDPGPALQELERQILVQDPALDLALPSATGRAIDGDLLGDLRETHRTGEPSPAGALRLPDGQIVLLVEGRNLIGRLPNAAVCLADSRVSRAHAEIEVAGGRALLRDLGSMNGTAVDGHPIETHELAAGETVSVGGVELAYIEH